MAENLANNFYSYPKLADIKSVEVLSFPADVKSHPWGGEQTWRPEH